MTIEAVMTQVAVALDQNTAAQKELIEAMKTFISAQVKPKELKAAAKPAPDLMAPAALSPLPQPAPAVVTDPAAGSAAAGLTLTSATTATYDQVATAFLNVYKLKGRDLTLKAIAPCADLKGIKGAEQYPGQYGQLLAKLNAELGVV